MGKHNKCMILNGYSKHQMPSLDPLNMIFLVFEIIILFYDSNKIPQKNDIWEFCKIHNKKETNKHTCQGKSLNMPKDPEELQRLVSHTNQIR